jgi:hypothetical protein
MGYYRNKRNINFIILILIIVLLLVILSKNNLTINFLNKQEIKHERISNDQEKEEVQEVFKKEDVIELIQNHLNKKKIELDSKIKYDFLKRYPDFLDCNKKVIKKWSQNNMYSEDIQIEYAEKSSEETYNNRLIRGFLVYFPIEKIDYFIPEFKWLYRSWIEMQKNEPNLWRTDLIVFIENSFDLLNELNCTYENKRKSDQDQPMCTLFKYTSVIKRNLTKINNPLFAKENIYKEIDVNKNIYEKYEYLLNNVEIYNDDEANLLPFLTVLQQNLDNYGYLDSILIAFEGYSYLKSSGYDYLIRSDMDVFMTPLFSKWLPKHCNDFVVGGGGYSDQFNAKRLKRIANDLKFEHAGQLNLGSTWFSTPDQFRIVSYLTLFGMAYIGKEEFTLPEREGKAGTELWPAWHYGVLLLYGQNLGMNHLIGAKQLNVPKLFNYIDYPTSNSQSVNGVIHLHCYHEEEYFSKNVFKMEKYDNMSIPINNTDQINNYCLRLALESKRMSSNNLLNLLKDEINKKK